MRQVNREINGAEYRFRHFQDLNEAIKYARKPLPNAVNEKYGNWTIVDKASSGFHGGTYEEAMKNASTGWAEGWEISQRLSEQFRIDLGDTTITKKSSLSYHGQSVNMTRHLMGSPRAMMNSVRKKLKKKGRIIKIFVHSGMLANVSKDRIITRGACILALMNSLEATGYRVEVESGFLARGTGSRCFSDYRFNLKQAEQPIDADRMGFALVSPAMHRVLGFRIREQEPDVEWHKKYETFESQGSTIDYTDLNEAEATDSDIYLGVNGNDWNIFRNENTSKKWLREQFEIFGVKTEDV